jgi:hypothetical protein
MYQLQLNHRAHIYRTVLINANDDLLNPEIRPIPTGNHASLAILHYALLQKCLRTRVTNTLLTMTINDDLS